MGDLDDILAQLEPSLGPVGGEPAPLEGGITNRNFRVRLGGREHVVRLHGKDTELLGISRAAELLANEAAAELGIAPAVEAAFDGGLVTCYVECEALDARARVEEVAAALRAFHESGAHLPVVFDVPSLLAEYAANMGRRGAQPPAGLEEISSLVERVAAVLAPVAPRPCHNDLLSGNLIDAGGRAMIVDWEYAGMGDPYFDLGNLAVNNGFDEGDESRLLEAYHGEPATGARRERLRVMRLLSVAREAAWGFMQAQISALDFDFLGYANEHLERMRAEAGA